MTSSKDLTTLTRRAKMKCEKCGAPLLTCNVCKGQTHTSILGDRLSCNKCNSTGLQCPTHGGYWKK
jgi:hypothetical protein